MSDPYRDGTCRWWHLPAAAAGKRAGIAGDTRTMPAILALLRPPERRGARDVTAS